MHGAGNIFGGGYRGIAVLAIVVFLVTPACSLICQTQSCHAARLEGSASRCHQIADTGLSALRINAAGANCGLADLLFALPSLQNDIGSKSQLIAMKHDLALLPGVSPQRTAAGHQQMIFDSSPSRIAISARPPSLQALTALRI